MLVILVCLLFVVVDVVLLSFCYYYFLVQFIESEKHNLLPNLIVGLYVRLCCAHMDML